MRRSVSVVRSLRFRLAAGSVLTVAIVLSTGVALLHARTKAALEGRADALLRLAVREPEESLREGDKKINLQESIPEDGAAPVALCIIDARSRVVAAAGRAGLRSRLFSRPVGPARGTGTVPTGASQGDLRVMTLSVRTPSGAVFLVQAATPWDAAQAELDRQDVTAGLAVPLALAIAGLGAWLLVGRTLRPVDQIATGAARITEECLDRRLHAPTPDDELGRLVGTLNGMIGRLEKAFQTQRRFTADASHELRGPLAALRGRLEVLVSQERTGEEYRAAIRAALIDVDRMSAIVTDLLSLARAEMERELPEREPVLLGDLAKETADEFVAAAAEKALTLRVTVEPNIVLLGDRERLHRLIRNLIENAVEYTPNGGEIRVAVSTDHGECVLTVSDTGAGIAPEELPRIFERFYRADKSRARATGGVGLGLAIAEWAVKSHHGRLDVRSQVGRGTMFTARLPVVPPGADATDSPREARVSHVGPDARRARGAR